MDLLIRPENSNDHDAVRRLNELAFGRPLEGRIVDTLRNAGCPFLSLVAETNGQIAGHIFFTPVEIDGHPEIRGGMGLSPMAVLPAYQGKGIGKQLIREGIEQLKQQHVPFVIVLGHAAYYPQSGFEPASKYGLKCQWPGVPDEAFLVRILDPVKMKQVTGVVRYREEWDAAV